MLSAIDGIDGPVMNGEAVKARLRSRTCSHLLPSTESAVILGTDGRLSMSHKRLCRLHREGLRPDAVGHGAGRPRDGVRRGMRSPLRCACCRSPAHCTCAPINHQNTAEEIELEMSNVQSKVCLIMDGVDNAHVVEAAASLGLPIIKLVAGAEPSACSSSRASRAGCAPPPPRARTRRRLRRRRPPRAPPRAPPKRARARTARTRAHRLFRRARARAEPCALSRTRSVTDVALVRRRCVGDTSGKEGRAVHARQPRRGRAVRDRVVAAATGRRESQHDAALPRGRHRAQPVRADALGRLARRRAGLRPDLWWDVADVVGVAWYYAAPRRPCSQTFLRTGKPILRELAAGTAPRARACAVATPRAACCRRSPSS